LNLIKKDDIAAEYIKDFDELVKKVIQETEPEDLIIVMGVGHGSIIAKNIFLGLEAKYLKT